MILGGASGVRQNLRAIHYWPLWIRLAFMGVGLGAAYLVQIPLERDWPGEPFLLFLLVVIGTTLCGTRLGLIIAVGAARLRSLRLTNLRGVSVFRYPG